MNSFVWIDARTPEQAVAELAAARTGLSGAVPKAGGLDLLDRWKEGLESPSRVVNLLRLRGHGMREVQEGPGGLRIGALRTLAQLGDDPVVRRLAPALASAAAEAATPQLRQVATLGGNLLQRPRCWYFRSQEHVCKKKGGTMCFAQHGENDLHAVFDNSVCAMVHPSALATALLALDGRVVALGPAAPGQKDGRPVSERTLALDELLVSPSEPGVNLLREHRLDPAEILTAALVPGAPAGISRRSVYLKLKQKQSCDWPLCDVAVALDFEGPTLKSARVVLGAVAPIPWRARAAEALLPKLGRPDAAGVQRVAQAAQEGAHPLAKNGYKLALLTAMVERALQTALQAPPDQTPRSP